MDRIHWSKLWELMEKKDINGDIIPVSLSFVKRSTGKIVNVPSCKVTSVHAKGSTLNIQRPEDSEPRTIRKCLIIKFNGKTVYQ